MKKVFCMFFCVAIAFLFSVSAYASSDFHDFTPWYGRISTYSDGSTKYANIRTKWDSSELAEFNSSTDTLELDLVFYNFDSSAYATGVSAYETGLPNSYLDTSFLDDPDEPVCSIGTYSADDIEADSMYLTIMTLTCSTGSASSPYKMQIQEGRYYLVQSAYSVFAETTNTVVPYNIGVYTAPETRFWHYEIETNNSNSTADSISVGYCCSGTMSSSSDIDVWKFTGSGNKRISLTVPAGKNYNLYLRNSQGTLIGTIYGIASGSTSQITASSSFNLSSGTYYLSVQPTYGSSSTLNYRILMTNNN